MQRYRRGAADREGIWELAWAARERPPAWVVFLFSLLFPILDLLSFSLLGLNVLFYLRLLLSPSSEVFTLLCLF